MTPRPPESELPTLAADATVAATEPVQLSTGGMEEAGFVERYQRGELLGRGGMGEVFACRDARIGRRVALKQLRSGGGTTSGSGDRARFVREARIQAQLEHPAMVPVYEMGKTPDGGEYFTMKRVRGRTLADVLAELKEGAPETAARTSQRRLLTAFSSVCLAVQYAHERGVLHRDLKPPNLMLGDFGEVYVLDWGVAKLFGEPEAGERIDAAGDGIATMAGSIVGTPGYAAPEQIAGKATDPRSDVYSLGAILFEILALEPLVPRGGMARMLTDTLAGVDARVSSRCPQRDVAPELEALCVRATALDPAERLPRAIDLQEAVERFLDGDRDLTLRRQLAAGHAAAAEQAASRALAPGGTIADREQALAEVGRAIALDPEHASGTATLVRLLTEPPSEVPEEVAQTMGRESDREVRSAGRLGAIVYAVCLPLTVPLIAAGVLSWPALLTTVGFTIAAALSLFAFSRADHPSTTGIVISITFGFAAMAASSSVFGVYTVLPGFIATSTASTSQNGGRLPGWVPIILGCLAVLIPVGLEAAGFLPPSHSFDGGTITILPRMVAFPGRSTELMLLGLTLVVVIMPALYAQRQQRVLLRAQEQLHMQAWQLKRLLPRGG